MKQSWGYSPVLWNVFFCCKVYWKILPWYSKVLPIDMNCLLPYNLQQQSPLLGEGEQRSSFHLTLLTKAVKADKEREIEFLRNNLVINGSEWDGNGGKKTIPLYFQNRKLTEIQYELLSIKRHSLSSLAVCFYLQRAQIAINWML